MEYEFDPAKSAANRDKHGMDFVTAQALWQSYGWVQPLPYLAEARWMRTGPIAGRLWSVVYTMRAGRIRLISARRARPQEVKQYEDALRDKDGPAYQP